MGFLSWLVPTLLGGAESLLGGKHQDHQAEEAQREKNEQSQHQYNMQLWRYNQAMKRFDMKKHLMEGFIDQHGLKPDKSIVDYLNAPDAAPPSFNDVAGGTYQPSSSGLSDFLGGAGAVGSKLFSPHGGPPPATPNDAPTQDFMNATSALGKNGGDWKNPTGAGPGITPNEGGNAAPGVSLDQITHNANLDELTGK